MKTMMTYREKDNVMEMAKRDGKYELVLNGKIIGIYPQSREGFLEAAGHYLTIIEGDNPIKSSTLLEILDTIENIDTYGIDYENSDIGPGAITLYTLKGEVKIEAILDFSPHFITWAIYIKGIEVNKGMIIDMESVNSLLEKMEQLTDVKLSKLKMTRNYRSYQKQA